MKIGLVIMASGLGNRFGGNKLMADLEGKSLIKWIIDTTEGLFDKRVVVTRSSDVKNLCEDIGIECIIHEFPYRSDTIRLGLSELMNDVDYCFFTPGDQPLIKRQSIISLIELAKTKTNIIVRTSYGENVGSPVGFHKIFYDELLHLPQGKGGSFVIKSNPSSVYTAKVEAEYELWDIDTVEDLEKVKILLENRVN